MGQLTYTTQEVQDRLDSIGTFIRPNLLDNAYFVGGGSQQGGGQFPINSRGQTSYSAIGHTIDRWKLNGSSPLISVSVSSDGLIITRSGNATYPSVQQLIENYEAFAGKTLTISCLYKNAGTLPCSIGVKGTTGGGATFASISCKTAMTDFEVATATGICPSKPSGLTVICFPGANGNYNGSITIAAIKLELGDTQTLAHQENGVWVLNEVPNYQQELAKCQRYFLALDSNNMFPSTRFESTNIDFVIPVPVTMRAAPTITGTPIVYSGTSQQTGFTFGAWWSPGSISIRATKSNHGLTDNGIALYCSGVSLSADL